MIYLDHNASGRLAPGVLEAMLPFFASGGGNPSSRHQSGRRARSALEQARKRIAEALQTGEHQIVFTSGGTEANNLAILGWAGAAPAGRRLLISPLEHPSVGQCAHRLKAEGRGVERIPVDGRGRIRLEKLEELLSPDTGLVSVMAAGHETGVLQPLEEVSRLCRSRGILLHTDAVQAFGRVPFSAGNADLVSISGHKCGGPPGIGVLAVRKGVGIRSCQVGGEQEFGLRAGTENLPGLVGLGEAAAGISGRIEAYSGKVRALRDELEKKIQACFPEIIVHSIQAPRLPNTSLISFPGLNGHRLMRYLDEQGVEVGTGPACATGAQEPSAGLLAMGISGRLAMSSIRFSLGVETMASEIDEAAERVREAIENFKNVSI